MSESNYPMRDAVGRLRHHEIARLRNRNRLLVQENERLRREGSSAKQLVSDLLSLISRINSYQGEKR